MTSSIHLAQNPNTSADVLVQLSTDEYYGVRWYVAQNPNTPVDVLVQLSTDDNYYVRMYVAQNLNTPVDVLVQLSTDEIWWVRRGVAQNPNTPVDVLAVLSGETTMSIYDYQDDLYTTYVGDVPVEFFVGEFDGDIEAAVDNLISEEWWSSTSGSVHDWTPPDDLRPSLIAYCERTLNG